MRAHHRRNRIGVLVGLLMSLLLALGQFGLVAASAGGWTERGTGTGSGGGGGGGGRSGGKATISSPMTAAAVPAPGSSIDLEGWRPAPASSWTDGNVCGAVPTGQCYRELDNVPHRVLFSGLTAGTEYSFDVNIEFLDGTIQGYDDLTDVVGHSGVTSISSTARPNVTCGSKVCKQFRITFTPSAADGEIRFNVHLAVGAHLWSGSNLSTQLAGANETVTIPVNEIVFDVVAHKFNDLNRDGDQDGDEPDLAGWTMTVYKGQSCSGNPITSGVTGNDGNVTFHLTGSDADNGGYVSVAETLQAGWVATTPTCQATRGGTLSFGNHQLRPNLTIEKTGPETVGLGGEVTYSITVGNTGTAPTSESVVVTDEVPAELSGITAVFSVGGGSSQDCDVSGNDVSCDVGVLEPGESALITISATAPEGSCPTVVNQAFVGELGSNEVTTEVTGCAPPPPPFAGIQIVKGGPVLAHVGDTITYTFDVSLASESVPLTNVTVTDAICDAETLGAPTGDDGDGVLEQGETWHYTCTHVVTATDPDPLPNTATVTGETEDRTVSDQDSHEVDLIHPAIQIVKTARPGSGSPGEVITYTYRVRNIGDVTLVNVSVDDDKLGHICDIPSLDPGETETCTASFRIPTGSNPPQIRNVGTAVGEDPLGETVEDQDDETIDVVLGTTVTPTPTPTKTPPGGTAFTGAAAIPLAGLALLLLTLGSGLLWIGGRRGRHAARG